MIWPYVPQGWNKDEVIARNVLQESVLLLALARDWQAAHQRLSRLSLWAILMPARRTSTSSASSTFPALPLLIACRVTRRGSHAHDGIKLTEESPFACVLMKSSEA